MKKVDFNKLQAGDLVEVPRTQFAPMRRGWNGWLFSEAVVIRKGVGRKSKKNVVVVEMRTPAGKNSYGTIEATFYAENVFTTPAAKNARNILKKYGIEDAESFYKLFMLAIWYRGKNSEPVTDEQVAAQMQQAEPLVIETPEAATEGSIRVYDYDGCCIYSYYGKIRINSDGKDGKEIDVEALGYLEGYQEHKEESGAGE